VSKIPLVTIKAIICTQNGIFGNKLRIKATKAPPANQILISPGSAASIIRARIKIPNHKPKYQSISITVIICGISISSFTYIIA
jgi:hypothetical protein